MKLIKTIFIAAGFIIAVSCTSSLSTRMTEYVSDVESSCENWTAEDWEISCEEYEKLLEEYKLNYDSYTLEEKKAINKAIGIYHGLLIRNGIEEAASTIKEFGERLPSLIDGFMSAFEDISE